MFERDTPWRGSTPTSLVFLFLLLEPRATAGQEPAAADEEARVSVHGRRNPSLAASVQQAVRDAARKLENPECAKIFADFRDVSGRSLSENLDARGETGSGYVRWLIFVNVSDSGFCVREQGVLGTNPGDRIIRLCSRFARIQLANPGYAASLVIHEELHALGLSENPPTSAAITRQVIARCGS